MKKWIAMLLAVMLVISMAACGEEAAEAPATTTAATTAATEATEPVPVGTLYVALGGTLELVYDQEGKAISITGTDELGKTLAAAGQKQVGKGCVFVLRTILRYASDNQLLGDTKSMVLRIGAGEKMPTEDFIEVIATDCQYLADEECTGVQMFRAIDDKIGEDGNLTLEAAKTLAARFMGVTVEELTMPEATAVGFYTFSCGDKTVTVNSFTGLVTAL